MVKTKVGDNPRGQLWAKDESRFGFQMLAKMGWKKGQGLGRQENGIVEPIKVSLKKDVKGLGYCNKNEPWLNNQETFDELLAQLNESCSSDNKANLNTGNLEQKSEKSKRRVHYHKFVKGKDAKQYSKKDLTAIIGRRTYKPKSKRVKIEEKPTMENVLKVNKYNTQEYIQQQMADGN